MCSDNEEIRSDNETDDIIKELLKSFLNNYQKEEIILKKESGFIFESVELLSYSFHKISSKRGISYMFSIFYNCCIKPSKHWKPSRKNIKY